MRASTLALVGLALSVPLPAFAMQVSGEPLRADAAKRAASDAFRSAQFVALQPNNLVFQPLAAMRVEALQRANRADGAKALQLGINRNVADEAESAPLGALRWQPVRGGRVARIDVRSPQAAALRVGIDARSLPAGAEIRVGSGALPAAPSVNAAAALLQADGSGVFWTAVTDGEVQQIELFLPDGGADALPRFVAVSHLLDSPLQTLNLAKALGDSGACNIDAVCREGALGQPYINAKNAVARMLFTRPNGTFTCTGTLLNDNVAGTQVPYFFSAAHCFDTQSVANTLVTFWNYETPACGVDLSGPNTQVAGGAELLHANLNSDALLLRLRPSGALPASAFFAGWDASTLAANAPSIGIHHPAGDNKKYANGISPGISQVNTGAGGVGSFWRLNWSEGTTEGGSSGSGVFTFTNGQYLLRGGLFGGSASCANSNGPDVQSGNRDFYSRLDQVYPAVQQWLAPATAAGPTRDYTGAWFVPAESGWGLTVFNFPGQFFALFFVYDTQGRPSWYRLQSAWTGPDTVTASLVRPANAPAWANTFNTAAITYPSVGSATLTFTGASSATLTFNDGTVNRTVTLTKL